MIYRIETLDYVRKPLRAETALCRCAVLQRARWAVEGETKFKKRNNETGELIETTGYADFREKYLDAAQMWGRRKKNQQNAGNTPNQKGNIETEFGRNHCKQIRKLVNTVANRDARKVWNKFEEHVNVADAHFSGTPKCDSNGRIILT